MRTCVVELVEHVRGDPAGAPFAVVRLGRAGHLHGDVVRVDLRRHPVEQDPALPADGAPRRPAGEEELGDRLHDRSADLAADLLAAAATASDAARIASERSRSAVPALGAVDPNSDGKIVRQASASVVSPFITARARTRCAGVASARSAAARATSGSAWIPA